MTSSTLAEISVVGGGWSFSQIPHSAVPGRIIAVNEAIVRLNRRPSWGVSMDRLWTEHRWEQLRQLAIPTWLRRSAVQNIPDVRKHPWAVVFECDHTSVEFAVDLMHLNGTNSGTCGLNLAYNMARAQLTRPDVYLFGFDMRGGPNGEAHWHAPYPWVKGRTTTKGKFKTWAREFKIIARQFHDIGVKVFNVSDRTLIEDFDVVKPSKLEAHLRVRAAARTVAMDRVA